MEPQNKQHSDFHDDNCVSFPQVSVQSAAYQTDIDGTVHLTELLNAPFDTRVEEGTNPKEDEVKICQNTIPALPNTIPLYTVNCLPYYMESNIISNDSLFDGRKGSGKPFFRDVSTSFPQHVNATGTLDVECAVQGANSAIPPIDSANSATDTRGSPNKIAHARSRKVWTQEEDEVLLKAVVMEWQNLLNISKNKQKTRFWNHISSNLHITGGINRNKRQCRERFNLLFWKFLRDKQKECDRPTLMVSLLTQCQQLVHVDHFNNIVVQGNTELDTSTKAQSRRGISAAAAASTPSAAGYPLPDVCTSEIASFSAQLGYLVRQVDRLHRTIKIHHRIFKRFNMVVPGDFTAAHSEHSLSDSSDAETYEDIYDNLSHEDDVPSS